VRVLRETGRLPGGATWSADRGLLVSGEGGREALVLAVPDESERVAFLPALGVYRALVDASAPERPGAERRELLGYGERGEPLALDVQVIGAGDPA
jgi:hypothetical protein